MSDGPVLVLTEECDPTADLVIEELNRRGVPVFRCDPADFPQRLTMSATLDGDGWSGTLRSAHRAVCLADVHSIYYRRPTMFQFPDSLSGPEQQWAQLEARAGFGGLIAGLPRWLNHPARIAYADYKPVQLQLARRCGLATPRTLITNEPPAATEFIRKVGRVVYKPMWATNLSEAGEHRLIYTTVLDPHTDTRGIELTAHLLQEWVPKKHDVRLTVVDDAFFAEAIHAGSEAAYIDWRSDYDHLTYTPIATPDDVRTSVTRMLRQFGLRFGAFDFVVTPTGQWVFLEINPNGQWAWLPCRDRIAAAVADALETTP